MSKDYERLCATSEAFIYTAMTRIMVSSLWASVPARLPPALSRYQGPDPLPKSPLRVFDHARLRGRAHDDFKAASKRAGSPSGARRLICLRSLNPTLPER